MKFKKYIAFTLAELMVIMALLTIMLAALAPVLTRRHNPDPLSVVWTRVNDDDGESIYSDVANKASLNEFFVGITPVVSGTNNTLNSINSNSYSKLIIRSSDSLPSPFQNKVQAQMDFRYGSGAGTHVASLFADGKEGLNKGNVLLGGPNRNLTRNSSGYATAGYNTSFGNGALQSLISGSNNTAIGYNSLKNLTTGSKNVSIGSGASASLVSSAYGNTTIGYNTLHSVTQGSYNTVIGNRSFSESNKNSNNNTIAGEASAVKLGGNDNTVVGHAALSVATEGSGNTAIGEYALNRLEKGSNNTALGYGACGIIQGDSSNKTCIGFNAGAALPSVGISSSNFEKLYKDDDKDRVYIGSLPYDSTSNGDKLIKGAMAVLEVHNPNSYNVTYAGRDGSSSLDKISEASVVINGNLVVRGQSFLSGIDVTTGRPAVMSYRYENGYSGVFKGKDGTETNLKVSGSHGAMHEAEGAHMSCVCSRGTGVANYSYDWFSKVISGSSHGEYYFSGNCNSNTKRCGYRDRSLNVDVSAGSSSHGIEGSWRYSRFPQVTALCNARFNRAILPAICSWPVPYVWPIRNLDAAAIQQNSNIDLNEAHGRIKDNTDARPYTCCPVLTSDSRLKNVGDVFNDGLDKLKQLKIYNYTYKNDKLKLAHVGVIAQDLKRIFPNAVTKDENGFYHIRWDEMFYAAINSVKELNAKVDKLIARVDNDLKRIETLKNDNAMLERQLDTLALELQKLEAKK